MNTEDAVERPEVVALTPDDDAFHPVSDHPYETETFWASFHDPERKLGGWFYNQVLFNQGVCNGGAWVWDGSEAGALYEVMESGLPLVDPGGMDLRDVVLPNGNHLEMLEPLTKYRVRRSDPGKFEADLLLEGLRSPHSHPLGVAPFWRGRHFDQCMHVTGQIVLHGETIDIDSLSVRDRSWGPRPGPRPPGAGSGSKPRPPRDPAQAGRPPYSPFGVGYVFGTQDADEMFLAYTLPCIWDGVGRDLVTTGYLVRDGEYGLLVDGERRCEFDREHEWMRTIWLDAVDEHGRELSAIGELVSHHGEHGQGTGYFHWDWNGASGYGEDQSTARGEVLDALRAARLWRRSRTSNRRSTNREQPALSARHAAERSRRTRATRYRRRNRIEGGPPVDDRVLVEETTFRSGNTDVPAVSFRPDRTGRWPAVVLGMEATGLNRLIRGIGSELASLGYVAFVPDYYRGGGPADPEDLSDIAAVMEHVGALDFVQATGDIHAALDHVRALDVVEPDRLAVMGYCTGATLTMLATCTRRDLSASIALYPSQPWFETLDDAHPAHLVDLLWAATCPMLIVYGEDDVVMSTEQLARVRDRLERWGVDHEVLTFAGAGHAFMAEADGFHHPQAAIAAHRSTLDFLRRHVPAGSLSA